MKSTISDDAVDSIKRAQRRRRGRTVIGILAGIAAFCTAFALILPAVTMEANVAEDAPGLSQVPNALSEVTEGPLGISLLYEDQQDHPEGTSHYTHSTMAGYIRLEPSNLTSDLTDVTVTLTMPKQYIEKESINIPEFPTYSSSTKYEILPVEEREGGGTAIA